MPKHGREQSFRDVESALTAVSAAPGTFLARPQHVLGVRVSPSPPRFYLRHDTRLSLTPRFPDGDVTPTSIATEDALGAPFFGRPWGKGLNQTWLLQTGSKENDAESMESVWNNLPSGTHGRDRRMRAGVECCWQSVRIRDA